MTSVLRSTVHAKKMVQEIQDSLSHNLYMYNSDVCMGVCLQA